MSKNITRDETKKYQAAGTGLLDYKTYFRMIKKVGYAVVVVLHNLKESQVETSIEFVKHHANKWYPELKSSNKMNFSISEERSLGKTGLHHDSDI